MGALDNWLTTQEAAKLTGYNIQHIRRLIRTDKLIARKLGRDWVIDRNSLLDYMKLEGRGPQPR